MPRRKVLLKNQEFYHLFNRTNGHEIIFDKIRSLKRALNLLQYYRYPQTRKYSDFNVLSIEEKEKYLLDISSRKPLLTICCYAFMPNHFHLLVKQEVENGIKKFMSNIQNGFAKYYNLRVSRSGSLFQHMFKAVRIEDEKQFFHVSRYIHLNPLTACLMNQEELLLSPYTSLSDYLGKSNSLIIDPTLITHSFKTTNNYRRFVLDQADYQKMLSQIKYALCEKP